MTIVPSAKGISFSPDQYYIGTMDPDEVFTISFSLASDDPTKHHPESATNVSFVARFKNGDTWHESEPYITNYIPPLDNTKPNNYLLPLGHCGPDHDHCGRLPVSQEEAFEQATEWESISINVMEEQMKLPDMLEFIAVGFKADRFKTLMSSLGIIIGVMAIVVMLSVGEGLYSGVSSQFSSSQSGRDTRDSGHASTLAAGQPSFRTPQEPAKFTDKDTKALENVVGVKNVAPQTSANVVIQFRDKNASASLTGIDPKKETDLKSKVGLGRFLTSSDYKSIVIGSGVSEESLPHDDHTRQQDQALLSGSIHGLHSGGCSQGAAADLFWRVRAATRTIRCT